MPKVAIRLAESVITDMDAIRTWYIKQGIPDIGERFVEEIVGRVEALRNHPEMGRIVPEFEQPFLRELIYPPFRIVYRRDPKHVRILRVWRSERQLVLPEDEET